MLLESLGQLQVRPGIPADLPGLDRHPVRRVRGAGVHSGLGGLGVRQQPRLQRLQLRAALRQPDQHLALLLLAQRHHRHLSECVEPSRQPLRELDHRVQVVDGLAAHESIPPVTTDRKGPLTCGLLNR